MISLAAMLATFAGTVWYRRIALRRGILAQVNSRTLHEQSVPRGGGVVFAAVFSAAILVGWLAGLVSTRLLLAVGVGGASAAALGFVDDVLDIPAARKLALQAGLAAWLFVTLYGEVFSAWVQGAGVAAGIAMALVLLFVPLWLINLFNFIDGIDGLAGSAATLTSIALMAVLATTGGDRTLVFVCGVLAMSSVVFLGFNRPPASIFMGDAGSIFLGYCFSALLITTVASGQLSVWTWIAMLGYFIGDTTTTTLCRMVLVKRWYGVHRSHAYQNLARIHKSHARVTYGVVIYQLIWAIPLAIWSSVRPEWGLLAAVLALAPAVLWTLRFGPRLSRD